MDLFLSYPSSERSLADQLALALEAEGHTVFFDRSELAPGGAFHQRLREAIESADAMIFLVTPASVAPGSYTLAELDIARRRWRRPAGHVLPVLVEPTPIASLPPYLRAVTLLQPQGERVAETVAAVARLAADGPAGGRKRRFVVAALVAAVLAVGAGAIAFTQLSKRRAVDAALARDEAAAAQALQLCNDGSHEAALKQLSEIAAHEPAASAALTMREDCAMRWQREMRSIRSDTMRVTYDQQVSVVQPVLLQGLLVARGARAADLRAHVGWGELLRRAEGTGNSDPFQHLQRALAEDPTNVYANAMMGNALLPGSLAEAKRHFETAVASGREREFVRRLQFVSTLGGNDELSAYAMTVADEMRRNGEPVSAGLRARLWSSSFGYRMLDLRARETLFAALPPDALRATFEWLFPAAEISAPNNVLGRFSLAMVQANAGERDAARAGFESLERHLRAQRQSGRLLDQTQQALAALRKP